MFTRVGSLALLLYVISSVLAPGSTAEVQSKAEPQDFKTKVMAACTQRDEATLTSLITSNRFLAKPLVDELLTNSIISDLQGKERDAESGRAVAAKVAETHQAVFGERSLVLAVRYVARWTTDQKLKKLKADSLYGQGTSLRGKPDTREQASQCYQQALALYEEIGDARGKATTLGGMGVVKFYEADGEQALGYFTQALEARIAVDDKHLIGNSYNDIGSAYHSLIRNYAPAIVYYHKAESLRTAIGDKSGLGRTSDNIALLYTLWGQPESALACYRRSIRLHEELGNDSRRATALYNAAILLTELGRYPEALAALETTKQLREKLNDTVELSETLNQRGNVYERLGEFELAVQDYKTVLNLAQEAEDENTESSVLINLGVLLQRVNKTEQAMQYYQKALELSEKLKDQERTLEALSNVGLAKFNLGKYDEAEACYTKALQMSKDLGNKTVEVNNLINLGNVQNYAGKDSLALETYQLALQQAKAMNNPSLIWPSLLGLGDYYERRKNPEKALDYYDKSLNILESIRGSLGAERHKASYWAQQRFAYEAIIHYLGSLHERELTKGYDLKAFSLAERAKSRAFLDLLSAALAGVRTGADSALVQKQERVLGQLSDLQQQLQQESAKPQPQAATLADLEAKASRLESEYHELEKEIAAKYPDFAELRHPRPITVAEVQSELLDDKTLVLEYLIGDSSSSLWAITKNSCAHLRLSPRQTLEQQIEVMRFSVSNPKSHDPTFFAAASYRVYQLILGPAESYLKKYRRVIVIPDGMLHYLPFSALVTQDPQTESGLKYSDFAYLIKTNDIAYAQSASVLRTLKRQRTNQRKINQKELLAFGDPVIQTSSGAEITPSEYQRLPYSAQEAQSIAKFFPQKKVDIFLREYATEEKVKAPSLLEGYKVIHFATHGIINEMQPDRSGILLSRSPSAKEDGFLQASEIFNLTLKANLVVLSACQTGLGKLVQGEGVIGLTRPFLYAGSRSVLVSLWSVSDLSTSVLMQQFYRNLITRTLEKPEALRQAQLSLVADEKFAHPFYWAPFVLIGDWR